MYLTRRGCGSRLIWVNDNTYMCDPTGRYMHSVDLVLLASLGLLILEPDTPTMNEVRLISLIVLWGHVHSQLHVQPSSRVC
jgi:hypothetical protein